MNKDRNQAWQNIMQSLESAKTYASFIENEEDRYDVEFAIECLASSLKKTRSRQAFF